MPPLIIGILASILLVINTLFWVILLMTCLLLSKLIPQTGVRKHLSRMMTGIAICWVYCNSGWVRATQKMDWTIRVPDGLDPQGWYFVVSNHQSWVDILLLQHTLKGRAPFLKFFLKQELIKVPVMGAAWWALDFPFMKRYSKEFLEKHPEMRGQDLETTRQACEKFKEIPTAVVNYLEGTRYSESKHAKQQSPYQHLLKPKSGGMAFAMSAMGDQFKSIIDVTIDYPDGTPTFWDFLQGKMTRCTILVEEQLIPENLRQGDYENDAEFRQAFQDWVHQLWKHKDDQLEQLKTGSSRMPESDMLEPQ